MTNLSLKEQLQAMASQFEKDQKPALRNKNQRMMQVESAPSRWLDYVHYGVELLKAYFPAAFKPSQECKPLKKGIKQDLAIKLSMLSHVAIDDKACMLKSLTYYVNTRAYHQSVREGTARIDLDGNESGLITAEEAKYSREKRQAKAQAFKKRRPVSTEE